MDIPGEGSRPGDVPLRVAVVGVAGIGLAHLFAVASMAPDYRLVGAVDVDAELAKNMGAAFDTTAFTSLEELLAAGGADAVVLAVPPFLHRPMARAALAAGLHVYCEKPLAATGAECRSLAADADGAGRVLQVGLQYRFLPAFVQARELIAAGAIGTVRRVGITATGWFRPAHYFGAKPWRGRWASVGGGVLIHQTCHLVDALISLVGCPTRVTANAWRVLHDVEVEDSVTALLEFPGGVAGTLVASTAEPVGANRVEIHGDDGSLVIEGFGLRRASFDGGPAARLAAEREDDLAVVPAKWTEVVADGGQAMEFAAIVDCHRDFVATIRARDATTGPAAGPTGGPPPTTTGPTTGLTTGPTAGPTGGPPPTTTGPTTVLTTGPAAGPTGGPRPTTTGPTTVLTTGPASVRPRNHPAEAARAIDVANAAYLSSQHRQPVDLPVDEAAYASLYANLCAGRVTVPRPGARP